MTVQVSTTEYQFSHGKRPRGEGSWAFFFTDAHVFWFTGKYADAKRAAVAEAKQRGVQTIKVGA